MIKYRNLALICREESVFTVWVISHIQEDHASVIGTGTSPD
jgi:hypothetical protein